MDKEEFKMRMEELGNKMKELGENLKDVSETAYLKALDARDDIGKVMSDAQSSLSAATENATMFFERSKTKISSELIKAQMNIKVAQEEMAAKKYAKDKAKLEEYIKDNMEYAETCQVLAKQLIEESKLAIIEAAAASKEYEENYQDDKKED